MIPIKFYKLTPWENTCNSIQMVEDERGENIHLRLTDGLYYWLLTQHTVLSQHHNVCMTEYSFFVHNDPATRNDSMNKKVVAERENDVRSLM